MDNNENDKEIRKNDGERSSIGSYFLRFIIAVVILAITSFLTPGFSIRGLWAYVIAAIAITIIDYLVEAFMNVDASPFGKGFKGFIISAIILYGVQFIAPNMRVSLIGALLASLVIGILDAILPGKLM